MSLIRRRNQLPKTLIAVDLSDDLVARLRLTVGPATTVTSVASLRSAAELLIRVLGNCVVLAVPAEVQSASVVEYVRFRSQHPYVPVVAFYLQGISTHSALMELGRIGVTELVSIEGPINPDILLVALSRCHADGVSHHVWEECKLNLPDALVTILKMALRNAHEPLTADTLATAAGMAERSLRKYCEDAHIPSPQWIIGWARLLLAGHFLDEPGRTIAQVAELLKFPSSCALRNQLRRYAGLSPKALRQRGSTQSLCTMLERSVKLHAANLEGSQKPASLLLVR